MNNKKIVEELTKLKNTEYLYTTYHPNGNQWNTLLNLIIQHINNNTTETNSKNMPKQNHKSETGHYYGEPNDYGKNP